MYYLDHDSGRLYEDAARTRLVESMAIKYGDKFPVCLMVLDADCNAMDIGQDVIRFGAVTAAGHLALYIDCFTYAPVILPSTGTIGLTAAAGQLVPLYSAVLDTATSALQAALVSGRPVHLEAEISRTKYEGHHVTSQTICVHVERDLITTNNPPVSSPEVDYATTAELTAAIAGVTAGTVPAIDITEVRMTAPDSTPAAIVQYDEKLNKYAVALLLPAKPGPSGNDGITPTIRAGEIKTTAPGTPASFGIRELGENVYAFDISLPLAKGDQGEVGPAPALSIGTVAAGAEPCATLTPNGVGAYKLNLVLPQGVKGDAGPAIEVDIGTVWTSNPGGLAAAEIKKVTDTLYNLDLTIPAGAVGSQGPAPRIEIGIVKTLESGDGAYVHASPTSDGKGYILDIGIPAGNVDILLSKANTWNANQVMPEGKNWLLGGVQLGKRTTSVFYSGYSGLAMMGCNYLMVYKGTTEHSDFTFIAPGGGILYSQHGGDQIRSVTFPADLPAKKGRTLAARGDLDGGLEWIDPTRITPTPWETKPDNEVMTKREFLDQINKIV